MRKLEWSDKLNLGIADIDDEHKKLLKIANALINASSRGRGKEVINDILGKLREYTVYHFYDEEKFMTSIDYPGLMEHAREHEWLKERVKEYRRALYKKLKVDPEKVRRFLKEWLIDHILGMDMKIAAYIRERETKSS